MAPKRKTSGSAKASTNKRASTRPAARVPTDATLIEKTEAEEPRTSAMKRRLARRDTEQTITKSLRDNFLGFSEVNTDILLHEGRTLRERLVADKRSAKAGEDVSMGAN